MEWRCVTTEIFDAHASRVSTAPAGLVTWVRVQTRSRVMWLRALQEKNSIDSLLILTT
jgi:hypothetical protein